jgi:YidC/Oxa1 family membrane protein insertase
VGALWNSLVDGMGSILAFLYSVIPNYGFAIIGLTVLVRLALFPLTAKQARSMQKMQLIQPELKRLQAQYKNDRQKLNEEIMKFYKENSVNPMAGCLPLVLQMPIFFALYRVLIEPHKHLPTDSKLFEAFCAPHLNSDACGKAQDFPKGLKFLGMDLGERASDLAGGFTTALPYFLLIALVVVTGYLQFKQTQSRQTAQANPQMAIMGKIFPVMFAFISYSLPSGVVLYFLVSTAWQIGQQALIFKTMPAPPAGSGGTIAATGSAPKPAPKPDGGPGKPAAKETPDPPQEGRFKRALREGRERGAGGPAADNGDGQSKPKPKPSAGGSGRPGGDGGLGRAQPSGSQPRPKKRRR